MHDESGYEKNDKNEEDDLADRRGRCRQAPKSEQGGDDRDQEEKYSPTKHLAALPCAGASP
jgi:hypothetical protein